MSRFKSPYDNLAAKFSMVLVSVFATSLLITSDGFSDNSTTQSFEPVRPFTVEKIDPFLTALSVRVDQKVYATLKNGTKSQFIEVPISESENLMLELERFQVTTPGARFLIGSPSGNITAPIPDVILYSGKVAGAANSHAYISFTANGYSSGFITVNGSTHYIARKPGQDYSTITQVEGGAELPPFAEFCGVEDGASGVLKSALGARGPADSPAGPIVAVLALDADQRYYDIFGDLTDAQNYLLQLLGAVHDIYLRDVNMRLLASYVRIWTTGGEPFDQNDLGSFQAHWNNNEDTSGLDIIHLVTGRRDLSFGGIAYYDAFCSNVRYSISGYVNGSFPTPFGAPSISNWDVIVMAHELGHNFGSRHTHDNSQYLPLIDSCAFDFPSRGTIMSYCHIHPGYTSNIDVSFPLRVQSVIETAVTGGMGCFWHDCNLNGIDDAVDIAGPTSADVNFNNIPDECEDCNNNSIFDDVDIAGPSNDINGNGIPDECEDDCDGNSLPDEWEANLVNDVNNNGVLDECEADCNANETADFIEIAAGTLDDFDRNNVPDICQNCNANANPDWIDLEREFNLFVADRAGGIREYHARSGYPIQTLDDTRNYFNVAIGKDRRIYGGTDAGEIIKINPVTGAAQTFWVSGGAGMISLTFGPDGNIYASIYNLNIVQKINASTGADMGVFVSAGSGGLDRPTALTFGPNGNLFATSQNTNSVIQYNGATGALVGAFVTSGSGGLTTPRGLVFNYDGNLLVTSFATSQVLEYDGTSGAFIGQFNDENPPDNPWGITVGPNGNVFTVRTLDPLYQVFEIIPDVGRYYRSFVRRDYVLELPAGLAFMPSSQFDCNGNYVIDACEGPATSCCCVDVRGDANGDGADANILDLTFLVDYIFRGSGYQGPCLAESNVNGDGSLGANILDLTFVVDRIFRGGPPPGACAK